MSTPEGMTTVCISKDVRKHLKHISAQHEQPMGKILSAMITHAVNAPDWIHALLHPDEQSHAQDALVGAAHGTNE